MNCVPSGSEMRSVNVIGWFVAVFTADRIRSAVDGKRMSEVTNRSKIKTGACGKRVNGKLVEK